MVVVGSMYCAMYAAGLRDRYTGAARRLVASLWGRKPRAGRDLALRYYTLYLHYTSAITLNGDNNRHNGRFRMQFMRLLYKHLVKRGFE